MYKILKTHYIHYNKVLLYSLIKQMWDTSGMFVGRVLASVQFFFWGGALSPLVETDYLGLAKQIWLPSTGGKNSDGFTEN